MYYLGIDIGGTNLKVGVIDTYGKVIAKVSQKTMLSSGYDLVIQNIVMLMNDALEQAGLTWDDVKGIGVGSPGIIDCKMGEVIYWSNLDWTKKPLSRDLSEQINKPVIIGNDADAAVLGEKRFGAAKDANNSIMITLGTGVGGGVIINGKLLSCDNGISSELGHTKIADEGIKCSCGRYDCWEVYSSARALVKLTKTYMEKYPDSLMWEIGSLDKVKGKTAFVYALKDDFAAREVIERYIKRLSEGIVNIANIFRPELIIIGGGVSAEGEKLTKPLQEIMDKEFYGGALIPSVKIVTASLGSDAGIIGAASLAMERYE